LGVQYVEVVVRSAAALDFGHMDYLVVKRTLRLDLGNSDSDVNNCHIAFTGGGLSAPFRS
jgi:hypothetical protein